MVKRYSYNERQQPLDAWQHSGLTKQHYCRQHDLYPAAFYYWLNHHHDDATVAIPAAFIPVRWVKPGKPTQNVFIERFNRTDRTEILDFTCSERCMRCEKLQRNG